MYKVINNFYFFNKSTLNNEIVFFNNLFGLSLYWSQCQINETQLSKTMFLFSNSTTPLHCYR